MLLVPSLCLAWGADGHRIVADIASHYLTPEAEAAVKDLLGDRTLADASADRLGYDHGAAYAPALVGTASMVVDVMLHCGIDDPQIIFESLNSTGLDLSQSDLTRNFHPDAAR